MNISTKNYRNTDIYKFDDKGLVKKSYGKAHEYFTGLIVALSELGNGKEDKIIEQKLRNQFDRLLANSGEHGCCFPVHKMPIYQDIISGEFMRRAEENEVLEQEKQQLTMWQNTQTQAKLQKVSGGLNNTGYHLATTLIGGGCMVGALTLLPESLPLVFAFIY